MIGRSKYPADHRPHPGLPRGTRRPERRGLVHVDRQRPRRALRLGRALDLAGLPDPQGSGSVRRPVAFRVLDGSTIKPLLDEYGNRPAAAVPGLPADPLRLPSRGVRRRHLTLTVSSARISCSTPPPTCVRVGLLAIRLLSRPRRPFPAADSGSTSAVVAAEEWQSALWVGPTC